MTTSSKADGARLSASRIALIAASGIALVAIGYSIARDRDQSAAASDAPTGGTETAPPQGDDLARMIPSLEARLRENPEDHEGWALLGLSYYQSSRFADAAEAYRRAAEIEPTVARYRSALGEALVLASDEEGFPPDAAAAFNEALRLDPADPRARYFLAVEKDMNGDRAGALDDWIALLEDTPSGAAWESDLRTLIARVSEQSGIDVSGRVPPPGETGGAPAVATEGIPGPTPEQMAAARDLPPGQQEMMVAEMVDGLARRLAANPDDADGWIMLMRSRIQLGQRSEAAAAWRSARRAFAGDAGELSRIDASARVLGVPGA